MGGVGFVVNKMRKGSVMNFEATSQRLCRIKIRGKVFNYSIIYAHVPTEDKEKTFFYEELEQAYQKCPKHYVKIVLGDMNTKIGRETALCMQ